MRVEIAVVSVALAARPSVAAPGACAGRYGRPALAPALVVTRDGFAWPAAEPRSLRPERGARAPDVLACARRLRGGGRWLWLMPTAVAARRASTAMLLFSSATGSFGGAMRGGVEQMDLVGCVILGVIAGVGGGTLRDLLLGVPVYWTYLRVHLYICVACSLATFFLWPHAMRLGVTDTHLAVLYADAAALASGAVVGAHIGHQRTGDPVLTVAIGCVTSLFGGIFVDLFCIAKPRVLHASRSMYATPALAGMLAYVLLIRCALVPQAVVIVLSFVLALGLRALSWTYRLRMPRWTMASTGFRRLAPRDREGPIAMTPGQRLDVQITTRPPSGRT
ncbi:hypothetical protein KFE25_012042 [Diacronema lutheri]|uniref:Glycine transporter domain-containing protein n=1 Tax=Diacronema lutheri TaxID=2081491 RepID=A0A8J5XED3_DIALT|nr:hypothetical protein KFE25_012042 [Diacronema lutheri]